MHNSFFKIMVIILLFVAAAALHDANKKRDSANVAIEQPIVKVEIPIQQSKSKDDYEVMCAERSLWAEKAMIDVYGIEESRAKMIAPMIAYASVIEDVPVEILVSIIKVESDFESGALSKSGAIGYAQVKPSSWNNEIPYNIHNPQGNILAGAYVLKRYYIETGTWDNAIRAYNIGITNFNKGKKKKEAEVYHKKVYHEVQQVIAQNQRTVKRI